MGKQHFQGEGIGCLPKTELVLIFHMCLNNLLGLKTSWGAGTNGVRNEPHIFHPFSLGCSLLGTVEFNTALPLKHTKTDYLQRAGHNSNFYLAGSSVL